MAAGGSMTAGQGRSDTTRGATEVEPPLIGSAIIGLFTG
jgi:hypothetical protein